MRRATGWVVVGLFGCGGKDGGEAGEPLGECEISGEVAGTYEGTSWALADADARIEDDGTVTIVLRTAAQEGCSTDHDGEAGTLKMDLLPAEVGEHQILAVLYLSDFPTNVNVPVRIDEITETEVRGTLCFLDDYASVDISGTFTAPICPDETP